MSKGLIFSVLLLVSLITVQTVSAEKLSLKDCLKLAESGNDALRLSKHDIGIQTENVSVAESSYLPRIDLQAGYTSLLDPQAMKTQAGSFEMQESSFPFASIALYQTLYDFGRRSSKRDQAIQYETAAKAASGTTGQDVSLGVIRSYFGILQSVKLVDVAKDEVAQREQHRKIAAALFEEGVTTRNDLLQADVKLAGSRQRLLAEQNRLTNGWLLLNHLLGRPYEKRDELVDDSTVELSGSAKNDHEVIAARSELMAQRAMVAASEALVSDSRSEFFPELFLRLNADYLKNDKVIEQTMAGATVGIRVNLFDGMATTSRQRQAVKVVEREKERLRTIEDALLLDLSTARNDMSVANERIEVSKSAILQGEENLRINSDRYKEQIGTATEVTDAQTLLSQVKNDYYQALYDYQIARARVKRAAGEL